MRRFSVDSVESDGMLSSERTVACWEAEVERFLKKVGILERNLLLVEEDVVDVLGECWDG